MCCVTAACSDGYTTEDLVEGVTMDDGDPMERLNEVLGNALKTYAGQMLLPNLCLLRVIWDNGDKTSDYSLMRLVVTVKADRATRETKLLLQENHSADHAAVVLFRTDDWVDLATFRSQINLLRADCVDSQFQPAT